MTEEAYNQCVDNHADNLYRFVLKSIKDIDRASDIIQDAFERLWRYKDRIDPTKAKSYLFTTAYHLLIDELNKGKRTVPIETEASVSHYTFNSYSDLSEVLQRALELLPHDQKMVLMLRDYEGYSYEEIEEITGLSESQVKVYIYRARVSMKKHLGKMEAVI
ncbi:RNA polymerase sigma factor [Xiashengella succiniciproducens]|uniref:RNA polymerase sigma factor n=1 Tax=Xiashengella succiniciproducens TaxID=2949635 RepID=A0A9J6ZPA9_9BACT|nr:RNA polymerase sigma factor [Alkaliflexus sp. Ai-910]URW79738.1 RNA polymerase sigma factor [Alkaliflexus sp. Ai-910]